MSLEDEDELAQLGVDELRDQLRQKDANMMLAAQLGKQLLEKNAALEARVEALERECVDVKERLEHVSAQFVQASNVGRERKREIARARFLMKVSCAGAETCRGREERVVRRSGSAAQCRTHGTARRQRT
jgi:hypothetical protein